jgi:hypothetical protein
MGKRLQKVAIRSLHRPSVCWGLSYSWATGGQRGEQLAGDLMTSAPCIQYLPGDQETSQTWQYCYSFLD